MLQLLFPWGKVWGSADRVPLVLPSWRWLLPLVAECWQGGWWDHQWCPTGRCLKWAIWHWLDERLQEIKCVSNGATVVLRQAINIMSKRECHNQNYPSYQMMSTAVLIITVIQNNVHILLKICKHDPECISWEIYTRLELLPCNATSKAPESSQQTDR